MGLPKGVSGNPNGRPKGAVNKTTTTAKEAIQLAAEGLGGFKRMIQWAGEDPLNERVFWSNIYPRIVPHQVAGDPEHPLKQIIELTFKSGV